MVLVPFGPVPELLKKADPWKEFDPSGPVLQLFRAESIPAATCEAWSRALVQEPLLARISSSAQWASFPEWDPWSEDDLEDARDCDKFPCRLKLDRSEVERMIATPKEERRARFLQLLRDRTAAYEKTEVRLPTEYPGERIDAWPLFEKRGLVSSLVRPAKPVVIRRMLELSATREIRPLRQIVDYRVARSPDGREATLWARDVYTDHYFDTWGEWGHVKCEATGGTLMLSLIVELDLLKDGGFFSMLARPKMVSAVQKYGTRFLDGWRDAIAARAALPATPAVSPSPISPAPAPSASVPAAPSPARRVRPGPRHESAGS